MIDQSLRAFLLPSEMIIKKFVKNEKNCNYEKYLLEFVNESPFFRNKSKGEIYEAPLKEDQGQCDCISSVYQMDFKLIASKTVLQARSILSPSKTLIVKGAFMSGAPKREKGKISATRIHAALRDYDFNALCALRNNAPKQQGIENDICDLLETLETKKNLLLFFPYEFTFQNSHEFKEGVSQIQNALRKDFRYAMQYRHHVVTNKFDTYMAFVYDDKIVFLEENNTNFSYVDNVELSKSSVYIGQETFYVLKQ